MLLSPLFGPLLGLLVAQPGGVEVLTPESAQVIRRLIRPYELDREVCCDWKITDLFVGTQHAVFHLLRPAAKGRTVQRGQVRLGRPGPGAPAATKNWAVRFIGPVPAAVKDRLLGAMRKNDGPSAWRPERPQFARRSRKVRRLWLPWNPVRVMQLSWLLLVMGSLFCLPLFWRAVRPHPYELLGLAVVCALAWYFRYWVAIAQPGHVNAHAYETLAELQGPFRAGFLAYGNAFRGLYWLLGSAHRPTSASVMGLNVLLGSLTVVALWASMRLLSRRWLPALGAAAVLAVLPAHVRLSASESRFVLAALLAVWAAGLTFLYLRSRRTPVALMAALAWTVAVQARPDLTLLPLAMIAFLPWRGSWRWALTRGASVAAVLLFCALAGDWILLTLSRRLAAESASGDVTLGALTNLPAMLWGSAERHPTAVFADPRFTAPLLGLLCVVGLVASAIRGRGFVALGLLGLAYFGSLAGLCLEQGLNNLRLQLVALPFLAALAALGVVAVHELLTRRWKLPAWGRVAVGVLLVAALVGHVGRRGLSLLRQVPTPQLEYRFLARVVGEIPKGCRIFYTGSENSFSSGPPIFLSDEAGRQHSWEKLTTLGDRRFGRPGSCELWYRTAHCYAVNQLPRDRRVNGMQRRCAELEGGLRLLPQQILAVDAEPHSEERYGRQRLDLGFYRIVGRR